MRIRGREITFKSQEKAMWVHNAESEKDRLLLPAYNIFYSRVTAVFLPAIMDMNESSQTVQALRDVKSHCYD